MQKLLLSLAAISASAILFFTACNKEGEGNHPKTNTDLLTQASWKFDHATAVGFGDVTAQIDACYKDNIITFSSNGTGNVSEETIVCSPTTSGNFTWTFQSNETVLSASASLFTGGSGNFSIVSLTETNLVISQPVTLPPPISVATTVEFTLKH